MIYFNFDLVLVKDEVFENEEFLQNAFNGVTFSRYRPILQCQNTMEINHTEEQSLSFDERHGACTRTRNCEVTSALHGNRVGQVLHPWPIRIRLSYSSRLYLSRESLMAVFKRQSLEQVLRSHGSAVIR